MSTLLLSLDQDRVSVAPGSTVEFAASIQNLTTLIDQVALRVEGLDTAWVQVVPPVVPVFAQGSASARIIVSPPGVAANAPAGAYAVRVAATSQEHAGQEASDELTLDVQMVGDYQIRLSGAQPGSVPQETRYPVRIHNNANAMLQLRLGGSDRGEALWYKFEPFALTVAAGGDATSILTTRVKQLSAAQRAIPFLVGGTGSFLLRDNSAVTAPAREVAAQFVQGALHALMLTLNPKQASAGGAANIRVSVGNPGAIPVKVRLEVSAADSGLVCSLNPAEFALGAQAEQQATLNVRASSPLAPGDPPQTFGYRVSATADEGLALPATADGQFVNVAEAKPFPWALAIGIATLALLLCFALAFLLVNRFPQ